MLDLHTTLLLVASLLAPGITAILKQPAWSSRVNWVVSALTAAGLGGLVTWLGDGVTAEELVTAVTAVFMLAQGVYHLITKSTSLNAFLEGLFVVKPAPVDLEEGPVQPEDHVSEGQADYSESADE